MGVTDESSDVHHLKNHNLLLEMPSRISEDSSSSDFVAIRMPLTPSPTPTHKRVNFLVTSRSVDAPMSNNNNSINPGNSASRGKSSIRSMLPKLNFKHRRSSSDIEKAVLTAAAPEESSSSGPEEKSSISRTVSLTKIFTPKINRTSSLPVEEIGRANTESALGGCLGGSPYVRFQASSASNKILK